jgi:hypothetical protein
MTETATLTPPRPRALTPEMKQRIGAEIAADLLKGGHIEASQLEESAADIAKHGERHHDGYALAKRLDDYAYWDCDFQMAEALDQFSWLAHREIENAEKEWAAANNIQPPFPVGTRVVLKRGEAGEITGLYQPAKYLIKVDGDPHADAPSNSRRIVNFEDCEVETK